MIWILKLMDSYVKNMYDAVHDIPTVMTSLAVARLGVSGHYFDRTAAGTKFNSECQPE
jgi:hypothetical protein